MRLAAVSWAICLRAPANSTLSMSTLMRCRICRIIAIGSVVMMIVSPMGT